MCFHKPPRHVHLTFGFADELDLFRVRKQKMDITIETQSVRNPRKAPKSRSGCTRCKAKRLKCDESKPGCSQCIQRRVKCPGYLAKTLVWSTKYERLHNPFPNISAPSQIKSKDQPDTESFAEFRPAAKNNDVFSGQEVLDSAIATSPCSSSSPSIADSRRDSGTFTDSLSAIRQQLHQSTVPEFLLHLPTMLVEYYFNYVCQIFSSFDGTLNPFRSTIGKLWDGSAPIYYAIQSMAAAFLANNFPRMASVGVQMQRETFKCLYQAHRGVTGVGQLENLDKTLLTILLIGQTTAWHNPKDLGLIHLKTAKRLNRRRLEQQGINPETRERRQNEFFDQCIMYWDMLTSLVTGEVDDQELEESAATGRVAPITGNATHDEVAKVFPHPWAGVAPKVQIAFAQVGRLIRTYRKSVAQSVSAPHYYSPDSIDVHLSKDSTVAIETLSRAEALEEELLSFDPPPMSRLVDAGDKNTPVQHYVLLADAYRCAALIEIYKVFPLVLSKRVPITNNALLSNSTPRSNQQRLEFLPLTTSQNPDDFLISLAMHTLSLLEKIPSSSGTRCLQPILVITAASELHFSSASLDPLDYFAATTSNSVLSSLTSREVDVASARQFAITRLQEFQLSLPARPMVKALQIVQETWARADLGQDVFWMDVMEEMGCESIFG